MCMGLYDQKMDSLKLRKDKEYIIIGLIVFVIVIIVGLLIYSINWSKIGDSFKGSNISIKFSDNPYNLTKNKNLQILVTLKNNSDYDAENSTLKIISVENVFFITCSASAIGNNQVMIPVMSKGSSRTVNCEVKVSPTVTSVDVLPGTYGFDVIYTLNNTEFEKRAILTIKK